MFKHLLVFVSVVLSGFIFSQNKVIPNSEKGFIENRGQILDQNNNPNHEVKYLFSQAGINIQLRKNGFSYDTYTAKKITSGTKNSPINPKIRSKEPIEQRYHRVDVELLNCNLNADIIGSEPVKGTVNYYLPDAPEEGISNISSYKKIIYKNIYPNIDLEFFTNSGKMEYQFILNPGADINLIKLKYNGAEEVKLADGKIQIKVSHGSFFEHIPSSFLKETGDKVDVEYKMIDKNTFGFVTNTPLLAYVQKTLVIDPYPTLSWGTYYGDAGYDYAISVTTDAVGDVIMVGYTSSTVNIATAGAYQTTLSNPNMDGFMVKFNSAGVRQWATYYGGNCDVEINGVITDASNNIYITGQTCATTGISTAGSSQAVYGGSLSDAFLVKFNSAGARQWGTYYGGGGYDWGFDLAIDASGNIYLGGSTNSSNNISTFGVYQSALAGFAYDAFVAKFTSTGARFWGCYYGGGGDEYAYGITVDPLGTVYLAGSTTSYTGMTSGGAFQTVFGGGSQDGFIVGLSSSNAMFRNSGTYYGGPGNETIQEIALDGSGNVYVTGETSSTSGISSVGSYQSVFGGGAWDCFIGKFNSGGGRVWGTYYGGNVDDYGNGIVIDASNNIIVGGTSNSLGNVMTSVGAYQRPAACGLDIFVLKMTNAGSRLWATFYGGPSNQNAANITEKAGNIYVTGITGNTSVGVATPGAYQVTYGGGSSDALLAKFTETATPYPTPVLSGPSIVCGASSYVYSVTPIIGANAYFWSTPYGGGIGGNTYTLNTPFSGPGGTVTVYPSCDNSMPLSMTVTQITAPGASGPVSGSTLVCSGTAHVYSLAPVTGATSYTWNLPAGSTGTSTTNSISIITGTASGIVSVTPGNFCGNSLTQTLSVTVSNPQLSLTTTSITCNGLCNGSITAIASGGIGSYTYFPGAALTNLCASPYTVSVIDNAGCTGTSTVFVSQPAPLILNTTNISSVTCNGACNGSFSISAVGGIPAYSFNPSITTNLCNGVYSYTVTDVNSCTSSKTVSIAEPSALTLSVSVSTASMCAGNSSILSSTVTGGTGAISYTWSPIGNTNFSVSVSPTITTTYSLNISDVNNCTNSSALTITVNPLPIVMATPPAPLCSGTTGCFNASGATSYTWTGPCGFISLSPSPCIPVLSICACTFTLLGKDINGCTNTATTCVVVYPQPTVTITGKNSICIGDSDTLSVNGANTYTWNTGANTTSISMTPTINTTYSVLGVDINGCSNTSITTLTVNPLPSVTATGNFNLCGGDTTVLTAFGASTYSWSTGVTTTTAAVTVTANTTFTVLGTDINGCSSTGTKTVLWVPTPTITASSTSSLLCLGQTATLSAGGANTYTWSTGATSTNVAVSPTITTTYTVSGTNPFGCVNSTVITQSVSTCLGLVEQYSINTLNIFPNPNNGSFMFRIENDIVNGELLIMNSIGQKVYSQTVSKGNNSITSIGLAKGLYHFILLQNKEQITEGKFVIE